jgi:hypothetical protein
MTAELWSSSGAVVTACGSCSGELPVVSTSTAGAAAPKSAALKVSLSGSDGPSGSVGLALMEAMGITTSPVM